MDYQPPSKGPDNQSHTDSYGNNHVYTGPTDPACEGMVSGYKPHMPPPAVDIHIGHLHVSDSSQRVKSCPICDIGSKASHSCLIGHAEDITDLIECNERLKGKQKDLEQTLAGVRSNYTYLEIFSNSQASIIKELQDKLKNAQRSDKNRLELLDASYKEKDSLRTELKELHEKFSKLDGHYNHLWDRNTAQEHIIQDLEYKHKNQRESIEFYQKENQKLQKQISNATIEYVFSEHKEGMIDENTALKLKLEDALITVQMLQKEKERSDKRIAALTYNHANKKIDIENLEKRLEDVNKRHDLLKKMNNNQAATIEKYITDSAQRDMKFVMLKREHDTSISADVHKKLKAENDRLNKEMMALSTTNGLLLRETGVLEANNNKLTMDLYDLTKEKEKLEKKVDALEFEVAAHKQNLVASQVTSQSLREQLKDKETTINFLKESAGPGVTWTQFNNQKKTIQSLYDEVNMLKKLIDEQLKNCIC